VRGERGKERGARMESGRICNLECLTKDAPIPDLETIETVA
jgi:hypothetical protein